MVWPGPGARSAGCRPSLRRGTAAVRAPGGDDARRDRSLFGGKTGRVSRLGKAIRLPTSTIEVATRFAGHWSLQTLPLAAADDGLLAPDAAVSSIEAVSPSL